MQFLQVLLVSVLAILQPSPIAGRVGPSDFVLVREVLDGNTIVVSNVGRVRLLGIHAPAAGDRTREGTPLGRQARDRLTGLLVNRWVRLEQDRASTGVRRRLAYVMTGDGTCVNTTMVREGLARVAGRPPLTRLAELQRAEAEARMLGRGIWGSAPQSRSRRYTERLKASRPSTSRTTTTPSHRRRSTQK
jgi:endonuclease YncB( thermonuclease family)